MRMFDFGKIVSLIMLGLFTTILVLVVVAISGASWMWLFLPVGLTALAVYIEWKEI